MTSKFNQLTEIIRSKREYEWNLGEQLTMARENFRELVGDGIDTWHDFLAQPEISLTTREANDLMKFSEHFSTNEYVHIPKSSLRLMIKLERFDDEIIEAAKTLSVKDFKERFYDIVTNEKGERTYSYLVMRKCNETGNLSKVHEVESEEVVKAFKTKLHV